ncbi:hypothetical protein DL96DRAFT_1628593 [Flagelloscypha sp. PMI_526]|nr:hypothetical protein DL96DRAFT_1628593 [Flagelloscypha sp. PMI_526]
MKLTFLVSACTALVASSITAATAQNSVSSSVEDSASLARNSSHGGMSPPTTISGCLLGNMSDKCIHCMQYSLRNAVSALEFSFPLLVTNA